MLGMIPHPNKERKKTEDKSSFGILTFLSVCNLYWDMHQILQEEIGCVKGLFGTTKALASNLDGKR